jgi:two-component system nitrate/nitrite response regulator NarL
MEDGVRTILLIDDSPLTLNALRAILELKPTWKVIGQAENGVLGLAICQQMRPDVVIVDFQMPGMSGIGVGREIRKSASATVLILFSLHCSKQLEDLAKAVGFDAVLSKSEPYPIVGVIEAMKTKRPSAVAEKVNVPSEPVA